MSFGINATNPLNQVIISADFKNLHLVEKQTAPFETVRGVTYHNGSYLLHYRVTCVAPPVPYFYVPDGESCGIMGIYSSGTNQWDIEILSSVAAPTLYIFSSGQSVVANENQGMQVFSQDGTCGFDSRARPLTVTGAFNVVPPTNPRSSYSGSGLDAVECRTVESSSQTKFTPNQETVYEGVYMPNKPMFFYASLPQTQRQITVTRSEEECDGIDAKGNCAGAKRNYFWSSTYWAFYRAVIEIDRSAYTVKSHWKAADWGCNWYSTQDGAFLGVGTGSSSGSGGTWPYSNETINLRSLPVLIGDASLYD